MNLPCMAALFLTALPLLSAQGAAEPPPTSEAAARGQAPVLYHAQNVLLISRAPIEQTVRGSIIKLLENTCRACRSLPLDFPGSRWEPTGDPAQDRYYEVLLFRDTEDYLRSAGPQCRGVPGIYKNDRVLLPPETLGLELSANGCFTQAAGRGIDANALIHEMAHLLTLRGATWDTPTWFGEGIAEYVRLAADGSGHFDFARVSEAIAACVIEGRQQGRELTIPPLEQVMNMQRPEFNQARGRAAQLNYALATLLTWYFIHLDGEGDAACLRQWYKQLQGTPRATAHLRYKLPEIPTPEQVAAERQRLMQEVLATRETYYYAPLLHGRSWQELEAEFARKVQQALGIRIHFTPQS